MTTVAPTSPDWAGREREDGVTVVLPAYREEANLAHTVEDMLSTLDAAGEPHRLVIVNDGSPDATGEVADTLATRYPGRVIVVHHPVNRGYGAAVRTGIEAALEQTDSRRLFLTDSDGQFSAAQLPEFIQEAHTERADAVIGYRKKRADPLQRKINAMLWGWACKLLLRIRARDVDCAYKLVDRRVLDGAPLRAEAGTISPEVLLRAKDRGARVLQRPVEHFPRQHGEQTGAKLSVIVASLAGLVKLWWEHTEAAWPGRVVRRVRHPDDPVLAVVTLAVAVASIAAYLYFASTHATLEYPGATSRLLIARRVIDSPTPGVTQLGGVWLPLPQLLALPTVWLNSWYYTGLAGSIVSMISYVLATRYLYRTALGPTGNRVAGVIAAVVFAAYPSVLYLQSTPLPDLLLIACVSATIYHLMRWCQTGSYRALAATATAMLLGSLTGYAAWVVDLAVIAVIAWVAWRRQPGAGLTARLTRTQADLVFYATLGCSGIAAWLIWNQALFHDALYFQSGSAARPPLWGSGPELAVLAVIPVALAAGYLAGMAADRHQPRAGRSTALMSATAAVVALVVAGGVTTLTQARAFHASAAQRADDQAAAWLRTHYHGGTVLMESGGNETVTFESHIPLGSILYEDSYRQWSPALRAPAGHGIRWIVMRRTPGQPDQVWRQLHGRPELAHYTLVYSDPDHLIYIERPST
jgi:hypothetical protein